ncbi:cupin domain-containing protein [Candidatus Bathyarchaeota archaeon]|nr:cupin domain-containing protein [Candidatus Bathyarchaeota archaeon]
MLETKVGSYRGNHVHPNTQYTLLLSGRARYVLYEDGEYREVPLRVGEVAKVKPGVPHVMVVEEGITTFEWWDGDFIAKPCGDEFKDHVAGRLGPEHFKDK